MVVADNGILGRNRICAAWPVPVARGGFCSCVAGEISGMKTSRRTFIAGLLSVAACPELRVRPITKFSMRSMPVYVADGPISRLEVLYGSVRDSALMASFPPREFLDFHPHTA